MLPRILDYSLILNFKFLGDKADETNLLKIVNNTVEIVGTKKAVYANCDIGANHFSRWLKNRL